MNLHKVPGRLIHIYLVYLLTGENKGYVGWAADTPEVRLKGHFRSARSGAQLHMSRALRFYDYQVGVKSLETLSVDEDFLSAEIRWISTYRKMGWLLWNETNGGEGRLGVPAWNKGKHLTDKDKKNKSIASAGKPKTYPVWNKGKHTGQVPWLKGKKHRPESNEKNRKSHEGRHPTLETIEKIRKKNTGQKRGEQFKEDQSKLIKDWCRMNPDKVLKGDKHPMFGKPGTRLGTHWSEETRAKHAKLPGSMTGKLGKNNPNTGSTRTAEQKQNMRNAQIECGIRKKCKKALLYNCFI